MTTKRAQIGMVFDKEFPAAAITEYARTLESSGVEQLWIIEDCFFTAGVTLAAAALAVTDRLTVGIGILPTVARNPAVTAMEIATLANMAPGRFIAGIGHGVQKWMGQMGVRPKSPLKTLDETFEVVRRLLNGEELTYSGETVSMDRVRLEPPPSIVPLLIAGVQKEKSLALAGRIADGIILVESGGPAYANWSLDHAGRPDNFKLITFTLMAIADNRRDAYRVLAPFVAGLIEAERHALAILPYFDDMVALVRDGGPDALVGMPCEWWSEIGAIGTMDDALGHIAALEEAGVESINIYPGPDIGIAWEIMPDVARLVLR